MRNRPSMPGRFGRAKVVPDIGIETVPHLES